MQADFQAGQLRSGPRVSPSLEQRAVTWAFPLKARVSSVIKAEMGAEDQPLTWPQRWEQGEILLPPPPNLLFPRKSHFLLFIERMC